MIESQRRQQKLEMWYLHDWDNFAENLHLKSGFFSGNPALLEIVFMGETTGMAGELNDSSIL